MIEHSCELLPVLQASRTSLYTVKVVILICLYDLNSDQLLANASLSLNLSLMSSYSRICFGSGNDSRHTAFPRTHARVNSAQGVEDVNAPRTPCTESSLWPEEQWLGFLNRPIYLKRMRNLSLHTHVGQPL